MGTVPCADGDSQGSGKRQLSQSTDGTQLEEEQHREGAIGVAFDLPGATLTTHVGVKPPFESSLNGCLVDRSMRNPQLGRCSYIHPQWSSGFGVSNTIEHLLVIRLERVYLHVLMVDCNLCIPSVS